MRRLCILSFFLLPLHAQDSVQQLVESLYPKDDRLKEIRMGDIVRQLGIHQGSRVADVGCGAGEFSVILSHIVGTPGKVFCEDIVDQKDWGLRLAKSNLKKQHVKNAVVIHGDDDNPKLPQGSLDAVLIVNAYHEMTAHEAILGHVRASLKPGGTFILMEGIWDRHESRSLD